MTGRPWTVERLGGEEIYCIQKKKRETGRDREREREKKEGREGNSRGIHFCLGYRKK